MSDRQEATKEAEGRGGLRHRPRKLETRWPPRAGQKEAEPQGKMAVKMTSTETKKTGSECGGRGNKTRWSWHQHVAPAANRAWRR